VKRRACFVYALRSGRGRTSVTIGAFAGSGKSTCRKLTTISFRRSKDGNRVADVLREHSGNVERVPSTPVDFSRRLRFHAVTVFANRALGCMSSKASITEIMIASA
jgi:hypothetical protein